MTEKAKQTVNKILTVKYHSSYSIQKTKLGMHQISENSEENNYDKGSPVGAWLIYTLSRLPRLIRV